jgi:hypothetical protein
MKIRITERQEELLKENDVMDFRRRINYGDMIDNVNFRIKWYGLQPYKYDSLSDFIKDVCNVMVDGTLDDINEPRESKYRDNLYNFMVNKLSDYIKELYDKRNEDYDYYEN